MQKSPGPSLRSRASVDWGAVVQGSAALLWLPQAALLAWAVQWPAFGILCFGLLRAACEAWGARRLFACARARLSTLRAEATQALAAGSPLDRTRSASGLAASVIAEQAEAVVPYLVRYQPARWRVRVVSAGILAAVATQSWIAALVLLLSAPRMVCGLKAEPTGFSVS